MGEFTPIETQEQFNEVLKDRLQREREVTEKRFEGYLSPDEFTEKTKAYEGYLSPEDFKKKTEDVSQNAQDAAQNVNVDEFKDKAGDVANNVLDQADNVTDKIPGEWDDQLVEKAKEANDKFNPNQQ